MSEGDLIRLAAELGSEASVVSTEARTTQVSFEFSRLKTLEASEETSTVLQVVKDGKLGLAAATGAGAAAELMDAALAVAEFGAPVGYQLPEPTPGAALAPPDPLLAAMTANEMIGTGERVASFLRRLHPDLQVTCIMERSSERKAIANTRGLAGEWRRAAFEMYIGAEVVQGKDFFAMDDGIATTSGGFELGPVLQGLAEDFAAGREIAAIDAGSYPVLFRPAGFEALLAPLLACLDGSAVVRGVSPLWGRLGELMLAPGFSLVEDGTLAGGFGSRMYDDQGVACRRTELFEQGVLREYLLDLDSAARLGRQPTGTGGLTRPRPNNIIVPAGVTPWRDMLGSMRRGIVVAQTMGAWAGNPYSGQVSGTIALGYLVEDGKIAGRLKDCMFNLNVFTHLRSHLGGLSRETKALGGHILPWALVENVAVAAREG